jgi:hypothetical protein
MLGGKGRLHVVWSRVFAWIHQLIDPLWCRRCGKRTRWIINDKWQCKECGK